MGFRCGDEVLGIYIYIYIYINVTARVYGLGFRCGAEVSELRWVS